MLYERYGHSNCTKVESKRALRLVNINCCRRLLMKPAWTTRNTIERRSQIERKARVKTEIGVQGEQIVALSLNRDKA